MRNTIPIKNTQAINLSEINTHSTEWDLAVGGFFRHFGLIELLTIEFIARMAVSYKYKSMKKKFLSQRLSWIIDNIHEHSTSDTTKLQALMDLLEEIREESFFRNILAHGSAGLRSPKENENGPPTLVGVMNFKPDDDTEDAELISLEEIKARRDEAGSLAQRLLESLNQLEFTPIA